MNQRMIWSMVHISYLVSIELFGTICSVKNMNVPWPKVGLSELNPPFGGRSIYTYWGMVIPHFFSGTGEWEDSL